MDDVHVTYRAFGGRRQNGDSGDGRPSRTAALRKHVGAVDHVLAVKGVSFVAHHGESIGLIGHNGSGKSTLMRAMAGLVPLSGGSVYTDGTASLLGVGGALMKDLTGERNIRLGCLALGLSPKEVEERYQEVADFADLGNNLQLPMRALSSGQGARLRFAISTAAQPDILLIDEALATGDAKFRRKSRERINTIRDRAGTVILVSHSMNTIRQTCSRGLWMHRGRLRMDGPIDEVVEAYEASMG